MDEPGSGSEANSGLGSGSDQAAGIRQPSAQLLWGLRAARCEGTERFPIGERRLVRVRVRVGVRMT